MGTLFKRYLSFGQQKFVASTEYIVRNLQSKEPFSVATQFGIETCTQYNSLDRRNFCTGNQKKRQRSICTTRDHGHVIQRRQQVTSARLSDGGRSSENVVDVKPYADIPGPRSYPVIGGIYHILPGGQFHGLHPDYKQDLCQKRYGNIYKETVVPGLEFVHLFDPRDIEKVYRGDGAQPVRRAFFTLAYYNKKYKKQQGLLTSQGDQWHRVRKNVQQKMLRPKAVAAYLPEQEIVADELFHHVMGLVDSNSEVDDLRGAFDKYAAECVGVVCFNKRLAAFSNDPDSEAANFIRAVDTIMHMSYLEFKQLPWFRLFRTKEFQRFVEAQSFIRSLSTKYTSEYLERLEGSDEGTDGEHGDLIPYLLCKTELTEEDVLTVISEFIFAGVDTTSHHLSFMMYLLGTNPGVEEKLYKEIDKFLPNKAELNNSALGNMSYLKAVTKETHRLLPVAPGNIRTSTKDLEISGYRIPAGSNIALHHSWISRQETYYTDAKAFKPERWIRGHAVEQDAHPFATLPFGHGVRSCVGRRLAEQEAQLAIIKLMQNFRIEYTGETLRTEQSTTVKPVTKMRFRLTRR